MSSCEFVAYNLLRIFNVERDYSASNNRLSEDKMVYINDIQDRSAIIAKTYFGLTQEDIDDIANMSERKLATLIKEGLGR